MLDDMTLKTIVTLLLPIATFFVGQYASIKESSRKDGEFKADVKYIRENMESLTRALNNNEDKMEEYRKEQNTSIENMGNRLDQRIRGFNSDINDKIDKMNSNFNSEIKTLGERIAKLEGKVDKTNGKG